MTPESSPVGQAPSGRTGRSRLNRRSVVMAALLAAVVLMLATTQTWVTATGLGETAALEEVEIPGTDIAEAVTAMALVGLASAVAVTIAGKTARRIIGVLMVAAGGVAVVVVGRVIAAPEEASLTALGEVTGTTEQAQAYGLGLAVWFALAGAVLLMLAGSVVLAAGGRWADSASKRYEKSPARGAAGVKGPDQAPDEFDLWDELSAGDDPTDGDRRG